MADDKNAPADGLPTAAVAAIPPSAAPPAMPTAAVAAIPPSAGPPPMPTAAAPALMPSAGPPALPGPLPMPTAAAPALMPSAGPPPMPSTMAAGTLVPGTGAPLAPAHAHVLATSPVMATIASGAAPITSAPPAMPATAQPTMPTMAGSLDGVAMRTTPPAMPAIAPASIPPSRYQLGAEIARGGMGRVVDATDTVLGRVVAFKEALTRDSDTLRRFERETRITARLEHPSIVPVHDAGASTNGAPFYVMRKVSGRPLEKLVAAADTLGPRLALLPHLVDTAQAIAHAHERGIVHRDIKPSNILVGDLGETVVIDWGLAKIIGEPDDDDHTAKPLVDLSDSLKTRAGIVYGTPGFMAPEQLRGVPVRPGFDVYALGATLYHLLSRKPPHFAQTADEMMKAAVAAPPTPVRELVDGVPPDLATIVDKALAHDPAVRYQTARALAEDLQQFLTGRLVASHHYSRRDRLVRFVRKNRGLSLAVAALILVGSVALVRIVHLRNVADAEAARAHAAELEARREGAEKARQAELLTLDQARFNVELNPTKAVAMIKPLAAKYWHEARAIGAAARAAGVAWGIPASKHTLSVQLSHDGRRALSAGVDGAIRLHDLAARTTRLVIDLHGPARAKFADDERQIVLWNEQRVVVIDAAGKRHDIAAEQPIEDIAVVGATLYWVDRQYSVWQMALADRAAKRLAFPEGVRMIVPSPDGRWLALAGHEHLLLFDRTQPDAQLRQVAQAQTTDLVWSVAGDEFAALIDEPTFGQSVIGVHMTPEPQLIHRQGTANRQFVAPGGTGVIYVLGAPGLALSSREDRPKDPTPTPLSGAPIGLEIARGGTIVAGATAGLTIVSPAGVRVLPLQGARVEGIYASPRAPYLVAALEGHLLVWNLDEIQPRTLATDPSGQPAFATADEIVVPGSFDEPAQAIDVATGQARPLGDWPGAATVAAIASAPGQPPTTLIVDDEHHAHLVVPGREPEDLPGEIDVAGFATKTQLVLATMDGAIHVHDLASGKRSTVVQPGSKLIGLAWGRGQHPWIAGAFLDGSLWRKNLATGAEAKTTRVPRIDSTKPTARDGKLLVAADGTVAFLHDTSLHAWRPTGALERIAKLAKPIEDFGEADAATIIAFARDHTAYAVARSAVDLAPEAVPEAIASIDGTSASMSADTGLLTVLDHGAIRIVDPLARQQWTLAPAIGVTFDAPRISSDGRRVLALTKRSQINNRATLLAWTLELPASPEATQRWLGSLTNATSDPASPGVLRWE